MRLGNEVMIIVIVIVTMIVKLIVPQSAGGSFLAAPAAVRMRAACGDDLSGKGRVVFISRLKRIIHMCVYIYIYIYDSAIASGVVALFT